MPDKKPQKSTEIPENAGIIRDDKGRFPKGVSGNPAGKPEGTFSLITLLKQELQKCPEGQDKKTYADLIVKRMLKEAIEKGDQQQIRLIWNYIEGMPRQNLDITSANKPLQVIIPQVVAGAFDINDTTTDTQTDGSNTK